MGLKEKIYQNKGKILLLALAGFAISWLFYHEREHLTREALLSYSDQIPSVWIIVTFFFLPMIGFPITLYLVVGGIRFGFFGGMVFTAAGMYFHNLLAFYITHSWFREPVRKYLKKRGYKIPSVKEKHRVWFTALFAAIHGPPYVAKIYLLALTDIPLRIYMIVGATVYILFSAIPVAAGSAAAEIDSKWIYLIIGLSVIVFLGGVWLKNKVGSKLGAEVDVFNRDDG